MFLCFKLKACQTFIDFWDDNVIISIVCIFHRHPSFKEKPLMAILMTITCHLMDHFTVVCLAAWPLNESEAGVDLVLIETLLLFICKFLLISMRTASLT